MGKTCTKCQTQQPLSAFYRDKKSPDGHTWQCKTCMKAAAKTWRETHYAYAMAKEQTYRQANRERIKAHARLYYRTRQAQRLAYARAYLAANRAAVNARKRARRQAPEAQAQARAYRQKHRARDQVYGQGYYQTHREQQRQKLAAWRQAHPEQAQAAVQRRLARKHAAAINDFTAQQWRLMKQHYGYCCVYCGRQMQRLTMDHLTPLSQGGNHTAANIVPACQSCNSRKSTGAVLTPVQPVLLLT
jgi:5-methylcytosine-specific restriction endonuclease McrA